MKTRVEEVALAVIAVVSLAAGCSERNSPERAWVGKWKLVAVDGRDVSRLGVLHTYTERSFEATWLIGGHGPCFVRGDLEFEGTKYVITGMRFIGSSSHLCRADRSDDVGTFQVSARGRVLEIRSESRGHTLRLIRPASDVARFFSAHARKLKRLWWGTLICAAILASLRMGGETAMRRLLRWRPSR